MSQNLCVDSLACSKLPNKELAWFNLPSSPKPNPICITDSGLSWSPLRVVDFQKDLWLAPKFSQRSLRVSQIVTEAANGYKFYLLP